MKSNYFLRTAALLLVGCMFGLCIIPGTLSRYVDDVDLNTGRVRAGIFRVVIRDGENWRVLGESATGDAIPISLFSTLYDASPDGAPERNRDQHAADVVMEAPGMTGEDNAFEELDTPIIAPGTGGRFRINVRNYSEVAIRIEVSEDDGADEPNPNIPIEWWDPITSQWVDEFPGLGDVSNLPTLDPLGDEWYRDFYWRWIFRTSEYPTWADGRDESDTTLGHIASIDPSDDDVQYIIPLIVRAVQID